MNILSATGDLEYFMILMLKNQFNNAQIPAKRALDNAKKQIGFLRIKKFQNPIGSAYILILKTNRRLW
ncbi:MAG: hypothetical protein JJE07_07895 [Flavobacteriaceae bacterium]|nr:hypothetical protein [Flavobacteriaceae bacterium]